VLVVPNQIETDNGTDYCTQTFKMFCQQFNITHITGIPYDSQGQDIEKQILWNFKTIS
jgi:transposase InsO family protein